jgi:SAM-dependent methyltransferase
VTAFETLRVVHAFLVRTGLMAHDRLVEGAELPSPSEAERISRRNMFASDADRYDRVRPRYPTALFDRVAAFGDLRETARVLEIGPGTGQATPSLVSRGWSVHAIELGAGMADVLRARLGDRVRVTVGAFEESPIEQGTYDLVFCATAFHWLDPGTRVDRVAEALRAGGTAAVVWTRHVRGGTQAFFEAAQAVYARAGFADADIGLPDETDLQAHDTEFRDHALFPTVATAAFPVEIAYDTDSYLQLISTYSETLAARPEQRAVLLEGLRALLDRRFHGRVVKRYVYSLVLARRAG